MTKFNNHLKNMRAECDLQLSQRLGTPILKNNLVK